MPGAELDAAVGRLLIEAVTPLTLEVALAVGDELRARVEEVDQLRRKDVERARYEAGLAERRYRHVDPGHRLVADALEADWNEKLRALADAQEAYERQRDADQTVLDESQRAEILSLATDFPRLWKDPLTPVREKKRMARLIVEDVTLSRGDEITAHVRFKGGASRTLKLPLPRLAWELRQTDNAIVREIDRLLDEHTEGTIAHILNDAGLRSGEGVSFHGRLVAGIRRRYGLQTRYERLRQKGLLNLQEMADQLGVHPDTVKKWRAAGLLEAFVYNDKNECLYQPPAKDRPQKFKRKGLSGIQQPQTHVQSAP